MKSKLIILTLLILTACSYPVRYVTYNKSCSVVQTDIESIITCPDGSTATIYNGTDGESVTGPRGEPGTNGQDAILEVIDPCDDDPNHVDEVLLRLQDRSLIAWYKGLGLAVINEGDYITTDHQHCHFSIDSEYNVNF